MRILLIEDEIFIRDLYEHILSSAGIKVEVASDGQEGIEKAKQPGIALVLLDIMLPKLNGIEVLKRLKADQKTVYIPIVLLTNLGQADIVKLAFESGAQGYFLKVNINPEDLIKFVNDFFKNPNLKMDYNTLNLD